MKKSEITVSLDDLGCNCFQLQAYYYYVLCFSKKLNAFIQTKRLKLVPLPPGINLGQVCVEDTETETVPDLKIIHHTIRPCTQGC